MPTRFDVAVPRTYTSHGEARTGYTRAGIAYAPDDRDRIDIVLDPDIAIDARNIVMPARPAGGAPPAGEAETPSRGRRSCRTAIREAPATDAARAAPRFMAGAATRSCPP